MSRMEPGPAQTRMWRDGVLVDTDVTDAELLAIAADPGCLVWVDLVRPSAERVARIAEELRLSPQVVEDVLAPHERAKVTRHGGHAVFTVYATRLTPHDPGWARDAAAPREGAREPDGSGGLGALEVHRISGIVLPTALVTIRLDDALDLAPVVARWQEDPELLRHGSGGLVHGLLDTVVDGHFDTIQALDDALEGLEDQLFTDQATDRAFQRTLYGLRKDLVGLRRVVLPMREVLDALLRHRGEDAALSAHYADLYDHVLRASEWTESLRDLISSVFETNLSLQDARLNTIMKKLAAWAAIIALPTLITGWFGQNVPYPGFGTPAGYAAAAVLVVVCPVLLWLTFRRLQWL